MKPVLEICSARTWAQAIVGLLFNYTLHWPIRLDIRDFLPHGVKYINTCISLLHWHMMFSSSFCEILLALIAIQLMPVCFAVAECIEMCYNEAYLAIFLYTSLCPILMPDLWITGLETTHSMKHVWVTLLFIALNHEPWCWKSKLMWWLYINSLCLANIYGWCPGPW